MENKGIFLGGKGGGVYFFLLGGLQERLVARRSAGRPCDGSVSSKRTRWWQEQGW